MPDMDERDEATRTMVAAVITAGLLAAGARLHSTDAGRRFLAREAVAMTDVLLDELCGILRRPEDARE